MLLRDPCHSEAPDFGARNLLLLCALMVQAIPDSSPSTSLRVGMTKTSWELLRTLPESSQHLTDQEASGQGDRDAGQGAEQEIFGPVAIFEVAGTDQALGGHEEREGGITSLGDDREQEKAIEITNPASAIEFDGIHALFDDDKVGTRNDTGVLGKLKRGEGSALVEDAAHDVSPAANVEDDDGGDETESGRCRFRKGKSGPGAMGDEMPTDKMPMDYA